jgi:multiple antibiotic resistance protein
MSDILLALEFILGASVAVLVISNPISTSAIFITLTEGESFKRKKEIAKRSVQYSFPILVFFALTGLLLFKVFGFSLGAFRIAGGVLLFTTATGMLNPKPNSSIEKKKEDDDDISLIPLSIPFTSGPGTIVTVVVLTSEAQNMLDSDTVTGAIAYVGVFLAILVTVVVSYLMMINSEKIERKVKERGRKVVTRLMGLIVMAIAVQFVINGVKDLLPEFASLV